MILQHNIKIRHILLLLSLFVIVTSAYGQANVYDNLKIKKYEWSMNSLNIPKTPGCDSVIAKIYNEIWYFNVDTLCYRMATEGHTVLTQDLLHHYYYQIADFASEEQIERGYCKMIAAAKKYNCDWLSNEAEYMKVNAYYFSKLFNGSGVSEEEMETSLKEMQRLTAQAIEKGYKSGQIELLFESFQVCKEFGNYAKSFKYAPDIIKELEKTSGKEHYNRHSIYFFVGDAYYRFRDYKRAIPCLKAALHDKPTLYFFDRSDLQARNLLGEYYAQINDLDSSDYYFRSIYNNTETVRFRPFYDVKAAAGIARNMIKRGNYSEALQLLKRWLPEAIKENVYTEITIAMGECYIAQNQPEMAKALIDDIYAMDNSKLSLLLQKDLYILLFHYYSATDNITQAYLYVDSIQATVVKHEEKTDALIILRAEQELFETKNALKDETIMKQKSLFQLSVVIFVLCLSILIIVVYNYRKKQIINKKLVQRILEQDSIVKEMEQERERVKKLQNAFRNDDDAIPYSEEENLFSRLSEFMKNNDIHTNTDITRRELAEMIGTNEKYLHNAIKHYTGMTFTDYINEFRLNYARNLFLENKHTIETIAFMSGFGSRRNFQRMFNKRYGLSPDSYKKQLFREIDE